MNTALLMIRSLFVLVSVVCFSAYAGIMIGTISGLIFAGCALGLEMIFKKFNLRTFNLVTLGLFLGFLFGYSVNAIVGFLFNLAALPISLIEASLIQMGIFLISSYWGIVLTIKGAEELSISIPFVRFKAVYQRKKDIILDISMLPDPRLIDLVQSGLLDEQLIMPKFALQELQTQSDLGDDQIKTKVRKSLETLKKLESIPALNLRFVDYDYPQVKEYTDKLIKLAQHVNANILSADMSKIQQSELEGLKVININFLSHALKPVAAVKEQILIKIQRYGKEARQGVGYLDDGTMVVVNGGSEFIGETIKAIVLSVKHTSTGRIIFCNAADATFSSPEMDEPGDLESISAKNYFAMQS